MHRSTLSNAFPCALRISAATGCNCHERFKFVLLTPRDCVQPLRLPRRSAANAAPSNGQDSSSPPVLAAIAAALLSVQSSAILPEAARAESTAVTGPTDAIEIASNRSTDATIGTGLKRKLLGHVSI